MSRTKKMKTASRGMLEAEATTQKEASEKLEQLIDGALKDNYYPWTYAYGDMVAFCYRTPLGWMYKLMDRREKIRDGRHDASGCTTPEPDRKKFEQHVYFHVIDCGASIDEFHKIDEIPSVLTDETWRRDILNNQRFQRAYRFAKSRKGDGFDFDGAWHKWACEHSRDEQFA